MNTSKGLSNIVQGALSSQKTETTVPLVTSILAAIQVWIPSIIATIIGIISLCVIILTFKIKKKQLELLDMELEEKHKRRKEDVDE